MKIFKRFIENQGLPLPGSLIKVISAPKSDKKVDSFIGYIGEIKYSDDNKSLFVEGDNSVLIIPEKHIDGFKWKYV